VKSCVGTQIFLLAATIDANAASLSQPRDSDPCALLEARRADTPLIDDADYFMSRHDVRPSRRQVALRDVQVRAAHAASRDLHPNLTNARLRDFLLDCSQRIRLDRPPAARQSSLSSLNLKLADRSFAIFFWIMSQKEPSQPRRLKNCATTMPMLY